MSAENRSPDTSRRVDLVCLVAGAVVLVICIAFAVSDLDSFRLQARVLWPTVLLALGVGLLVSSRRA